MTDEERELPPEQEAAVRRLLAEARATEPVPADVAARLDRVLVGLGEDGFPAAATGHVVAPPWRRRRAAVVLVAAAAVVAIGVGVGQIDGIQGGSDSDAGGGAGDAAVTPSGRPGLRRGRRRRRRPGGGAQREAVDGGRPGTRPLGAGRPRPRGPLHRRRQPAAPGHPRRRRRRRVRPAHRATSSRPATWSPTGRSSARAAAWGPGVLVPVFFDGTPAVLAYRPVTGESQIVDLLRCGTGESLRSTTLQAG